VSEGEKTAEALVTLLREENAAQRERISRNELELAQLPH